MGPGCASLAPGLPALVVLGAGPCRVLRAWAPWAGCGELQLPRLLWASRTPVFWIGLRESGLMGTARWALQGTCQWALSKEMHSCLHVRISLRLPACSQARGVFTRANYHVAVQAPWPGQEVACMRPHTWVGSQGGGPPLGKGARPAGGGPPLLRPPSGPHLAAAVWCCGTRCFVDSPVVESALVSEPLAHGHVNM